MGFSLATVNMYVTHGRKEAENISFHYQCQGPQQELGSHALL